MELTYNSVTQLYVDLRAQFLSTGLTIVRTIVPDTDIVFDTSTGFLRFQRQIVSPTTSAIGWAFGVDADVLAVQTPDSERILPFTIDSGVEFSLTLDWYAPTRRVNVVVMARVPETLAYRRYLAELGLDSKVTSVYHEDNSNPQYQPNFKDTGGPYIRSGA